MRLGRRERPALGRRRSQPGHPADHPVRHRLAPDTQITQDIRFLAGLGADLIILDPNPDTPRPRDYACERNDLLAVRAALATNA